MRWTPGLSTRTRARYAGISPAGSTDIPLIPAAGTTSGPEPSTSKGFPHSSSMRRVSSTSTPTSPSAGARATSLSGAPATTGNPGTGGSWIHRWPPSGLIRKSSSASAAKVGARHSRQTSSTRSPRVSSPETTSTSIW